MEVLENSKNHSSKESERISKVIEEWKRRRAEDIRLFEEERKTPEYKQMIEELRKKNEGK